MVPTTTIYRSSNSLGPRGCERIRPRLGSSPSLLDTVRSGTLSNLTGKAQCKPSHTATSSYSSRCG